MTRKVLPPLREQIEGLFDSGRSLASTALVAAKDKLTGVQNRWSKFDPKRRRTLGLIVTGLGIVTLASVIGWRFKVLSNEHADQHQLESLLSEPDKEFLDNIPEGPISTEDIPLLTEAVPFMELIKNYKLPVEQRGAVLDPQSGGVLLYFEGLRKNENGNIEAVEINPIGYLGSAIVNKLDPDFKKQGLDEQTVFIPATPGLEPYTDDRFNTAVSSAMRLWYEANGDNPADKGFIFIPLEFLPNIGFIDSFDKEGLLKNHLKGVALPLTKSTLDAPNIERLNEDIGEGNLNQLMIPLNNLPRIAGLMGLPKKVMVFFNPRFRGNEENNPSNPIPRDRRTPSTPTPAPQPSGQFVA